jgi:hypothetical protein
MKNTLSELDTIITELEHAGLHKEATVLNGVFIRLAKHHKEQHHKDKTGPGPPHEKNVNIDGPHYNIIDHGYSIGIGADDGDGGTGDGGDGGGE